VLQVPGSGTRPTSDRVRESLFAALESAGELEDARVLDLYAGSGALGLESLSRGATVVDLVEKAPSAAQVATRNATRIAGATDGTAQVHRAAALTWLARSPGTRYTLVFLDPPYDVTDDELAETLRALDPHLDVDALVVVERGKRSPEPQWTDTRLKLERTKTYGDTTMWWARVSA